MRKSTWRTESTYYRPYEPAVRCSACGGPAVTGAWCARSVCAAERDRYRAVLIAFATKYPETPDRLAAIERGEAPEIHNTARENAA